MKKFFVCYMENKIKKNMESLYVTLNDDVDHIKFFKENYSDSGDVYWRLIQ